MPTAITEADLTSYLGLQAPEVGSSDAFVLALVVQGVNTLVPTTVPRVRALAAGVDWPDDVYQGALMQAARLWQRRRNPGSIGSYADTTGTAQYISRWDPDIERLMLTGKWAPPAFG